MMYNNHDDELASFTKIGISPLYIADFLCTPLHFLLHNKRTENNHFLLLYCFILLSSQKLNYNMNVTTTS